MTAREAAIEDPDLPVNCPKCYHPMLGGPLRLKRSGDYRVADWYCANCHHAIWAAKQEEEHG